MRINLTKKDLVNLIYMQIGFSKQISEKSFYENWSDDIFERTIESDFTKNEIIEFCEGDKITRSTFQKRFN